MRPETRWIAFALLLLVAPARAGDALSAAVDAAADQAAALRAAAAAVRAQNRAQWDDEEKARLAQRPALAGETLAKVMTCTEGRDTWLFYREPGGPAMIVLHYLDGRDGPALLGSQALSSARHQFAASPEPVFDKTELKAQGFRVEVAVDFVHLRAYAGAKVTATLADNAAARPVTCEVP